MAGRLKLKLETKGFENLISELDGLGGDVKDAITNALGQTAETIEWDTKDAVKAANLPAKGKYSQGDTEASIVSNARVRWSGTVAEIGVGFDYAKRGAGGLLITGTPRMRPDYALENIYARKKYMKQIQDDFAEIIEDHIIRTMQGGKK